MKRWREPTAKPGQLKAQYGKQRFSASPELLYVWGGKGASSPDARVLGYALEDAPVFDGKSLVQVLTDRGYDVTTLRFTVDQLPLPRWEGRTDPRERDMKDSDLFQAVLNRIGQQGDMHIRIRSETFRRILLSNGYAWNFDTEPYREIDAVALEALVMRAGHQPFKQPASPPLPDTGLQA